MTFRLFILSLSLIILSCKANSTKETAFSFLLDFESQAIEDSSYTVKLIDGVIDSTQTIEGKSSFKLSKDAKFPIQIILHKLNPKSIHRLSFWSKGGNSLKINLKENHQKVPLLANRVVSRKNGWEKRECIIVFPFINKPSEVEIIVSKPQGVESWIDHLLIEHINSDQAKNIFKLNLKKEEFEKITNYRNDAFHRFIIEGKNKKWVKGQLNKENTNLKLKGDWTDHITEGIWSFKLNSKKDLIPGIRSFNIQTPVVRNFHKEWLFFELCKDQGLTSPSFEFNHVSYNGSDPFYCAFEENFSHQFIERKLGYKSPVLRLFEDHLFPFYTYSWSHTNSHALKFETTYIYPFDKGYYSEKGRKQFDESALKLRRFINGDLSTADYDKWATLFAITSLTKSFHGLAWHNQRYFLNNNGKIEPVPYDGNSPYGAAESWGRKKAILGDFSGLTELPENPMYKFQMALFSDPKFREVYVKKLNQVSNKDYLENFVSKRKHQLSDIYKFSSVFYDFDT